MSREPRLRKVRPPERVVPSARPAFWERGLSLPAICLCFVVGILFFYWEPLFNSAASIQWDAADVHYSSQKYFADSIRSGHLPFWTPYVFSGMPFLADPQVGAWYPLNWPFFLLGITPKTIEWEMALHCLIAAIGAFLLARDLLGSRWAASFCAVFYALSGFFAGHSAHTGIFQAASLFPWILWTGLRAARSYRWLPTAFIAAGLIVLTGHFQTALYAMCALGLLLAADFAIQRGSPIRTLVALAAAVAGACALPAVMSLPGLELTAASDRASSYYSRNTDAVITPGALLTLVSPDHFGALEVENYTGPSDITQFFWYQGILLLPLAAAGLALSNRRWHALALVVPALWYACGPSAGLYSLASQFPGLRSVRSPVHAWFVVALGLALLAAAGVSALRARMTAWWIPLILLAVVGGDLWYWNMHNNRLAYADQSFYDLYGFPQERFNRVANLATPAGSLHRLWAPFDSPGFGPLNGELDTHTEVTYGYNPLSLSRYNRYIAATDRNPRLLDSLAVTAKLNSANGLFLPNATALPRVFAPPSVSAASGAEAAAHRLNSLDPSKEAVVEGIPAMPQNGPADLALTRYEASLYKIRYRAARPTLVRLAVPYFPGWRAEVDGHAVPVVPVDLALMGAVLPEGTHDIVFQYRSNWFLTGALVSALAFVAALIWLVWSFRAPRPATQGQG